LQYCHHLKIIKIQLSEQQQDVAPLVVMGDKVGTMIVIIRGGMVHQITEETITTMIPKRNIVN